jgi:hypothetical protein
MLKAKIKFKPGYSKYCGRRMRGADGVERTIANHPTIPGKCILRNPDHMQGGRRFFDYTPEQIESIIKIGGWKLVD